MMSNTGYCRPATLNVAVGTDRIVRHCASHCASTVHGPHPLTGATIDLEPIGTSSMQARGVSISSIVFGVLAGGFLVCLAVVFLSGRASAAQPTADPAAGSLAAPATTVVGQVAAPVADVVSPVATVVAQVASPVTTGVDQVASPVTSLVGDVVAPVGAVVSPVTNLVGQVASPVTTVVGQVASPVTTLVGQVTAPLTVPADQPPALPVPTTGSLLALATPAGAVSSSPSGLGALTKAVVGASGPATTFDILPAAAGSKTLLSAVTSAYRGPAWLQPGTNQGRPVTGEATRSDVLGASVLGPPSPFRVPLGGNGGVLPPGTPASVPAPTANGPSSSSSSGSGSSAAAYVATDSSEFANRAERLGQRGSLPLPEALVEPAISPA